MMDEQKKPEPTPNQLGAQPAVLTAQITITRKATGAVEHYTITGTPVKQKED